MIKKFPNLYKSHTYKKMKKFNLKSKKLLTTALFITSGLTILSHSNPVKASACPDASSVTSPNGSGDATSFIALSEGSCYETPEEYGVTIYKMGLCTSNPAPSSAGSAPDTSSCSFNFEKDDGVGEAASFAAGGEVDLSATYSSRPDVGEYEFAYIEIKNSFDIKAKYGPLGDAANTTYFTNGTFGAAGTVTGASTTPTASDGYATTTAPLNTFFGDGGTAICAATASESVSGGTIRAYLLDSSDKLIADDSTVTECSGVKKLLGIMQLNTKVNITASTTSVKTTFKVTDNGSTVIYDDGTDGLQFDSGPFSVSFETSE
tara:strand:+ start:900 stop:1856 length:957 start_codon:yes stop_codon:yes gene_type:complete